MKILPAVTRPWREVIVRRHHPRVARGASGFQAYRACLRWDFGFSCAFCLCHEADLAPYGAEGAALTHVEHFVPKSLSEKGRNDYTNCFYICRFCNISRGAQPNTDATGRSLLDPCARAWRAVFVADGDEIRPRDERDVDAIYTHDVYELNDRRKVRMRKIRRVIIDQRIRYLSRTRNLESELLDRAEAGGGTETVKLAWAISTARAAAYRDLERFPATPYDRDPACSCGHTGHHRLPRVLEEQTIEVSDRRSRRRPPPRRGGEMAGR